MGRKKPAPQPLSLSESNNPQPRATVVSRSATTTSPTAASHDASALSAELETRSSASTRTALSPADSRSPSSQTATARSSPFSSRFAQKRPQTARAGNQPKTADFESFDKRRPSQSYFDPQAHKPNAYPHIASAYNPSNATPPQTAHPESQSRKTSKGGFFHFAKSSKSSNQILGHASQPSVSSRGDPQSRENGRGQSTARQGGVGTQPPPLTPNLELGARGQSSPLFHTLKERSSTGAFINTSRAH